MPIIDFEEHFVYATPFVLRSVCRFWKQIVDGNPSLWTSLSLNFDAKNNTSALQNAFDLVPRNSALRPLSICVEHEDEESMKDDCEIPALSLIEKASGRTESFQIYAPVEALKMAGACWRAFPSNSDIPLRKLDIKIELLDEDRLELDDVMRPFIGGYPQATLQDLAISVSCTDRLPEEVCDVFWAAASGFDWSALTTLKLATKDVTINWDIQIRFPSSFLSLVHNLQHLHIDGDVMCESQIILQSLRTLYVGLVVSVETLLPFLICPALEELTMGGCRINEFGVDFIAQCAPTLIRLSIKLPLFGTSVHDLLQYYSIGFSAQRVTALTLSMRWNTDMSLYFLSLSPSSFPVLEQLDINIRLLRDIDLFPWFQVDICLSDTVARLLPGSHVPLKKFSLMFNMSGCWLNKEEFDDWWARGIGSAVIQQLGMMKRNDQCKGSAISAEYTLPRIEEPWSLI